MFNHSRPAEAPAPSPLDPAQQNDFREVVVDPAVEREVWAQRRSAHDAPTELAGMREANSDEWSALTLLDLSGVALGGHVATQVLGDDEQRRSATFINTASPTTDPTAHVYLAPYEEAFSANLAVPRGGFRLPPGATLTITTTRPVWAQAAAANAGLSIWVERGARS